MKPKRLISLLVAVCMVVAMLPVSAFAANAEDEFEYTYEGVTLKYKITSVENSTVEVTKNTGVTGSIKIPAIVKDASEKEYTVTAIGQQAFFSGNDTNNPNNLTSVEMPATLKNIGDSAFSNNNNLKNPRIPEGVTTIGNWAFNCVWATSEYEIPASVTYIGMGAFQYNSIKKVTFAQGSKLNKLDAYAFQSCGALQEVVLPEGLVTIGKDAFIGCTGLKRIEIPESVRELGETPLLGCTGLKDICYAGTNDSLFDNQITADQKNIIRHKCSVTFEINGHGIAPQSQTVWSSKMLEKVADPTAAGYTFTGWYTDEALTQKFDIENDAITDDTTLYAGWKPIPDHELTVKGGTFTYDDNAAADKGSVYEGAVVTVTLDENNQLWKDSGLSFDHWDIQSKTKLLDENGEEIVNPGKTFTFVMPKEGVTIEAMTKDATIEDDGSSVLGTVAIGATVVAGTAVLAYQGYMLGTEFWLNYHLPYDVDIPANRAELAQLVWDDAGRPEPAAVLNADASNADKALVWAVENQLMAAADKNGEVLAPDASVSRVDVIRTWKKYEQMKAQ